jgi:hypothetical protein
VTAPATPGPRPVHVLHEWVAGSAGVPTSSATGERIQKSGKGYSCTGLTQGIKLSQFLKKNTGLELNKFHWNYFRAGIGRWLHQHGGVAPKRLLIAVTATATIEGGRADTFPSPFSFIGNRTVP